MSNASETRTPTVLLKLKHVVQRTGLARSSIYSKLDPKSPQYDSSFPRQVRLGAASVAWVEAEIDEWIDSRIEMREKEKGAM